MIVLHKKDIAKYLEMDARLKEALQMIADGAVDHQEVGKVIDSENLYHNVQCYETKPFEKTRYESHELWIDIQYIKAGQERMDVLISGDGAEQTEHNKEKDCIFYQSNGSANANQLYLTAGMLAVFYPEDIHRPCICVDGPETVEKVVFKVRV